jgi:hypothetical protein
VQLDDVKVRRHDQRGLGYQNGQEQKANIENPFTQVLERNLEGKLFCPKILRLQLSIFLAATFDG